VAVVFVPPATNAEYSLASVVDLATQHKPVDMKYIGVVERIEGVEDSLEGLIVYRLLCKATVFMPNAFLTSGVSVIIVSGC
jgi:hypothetical protein